MRTVRPPKQNKIEDRAREERRGEERRGDEMEGEESMAEQGGGHRSDLSNTKRMQVRIMPHGVLNY